MEAPRSTERTGLASGVGRADRRSEGSQSRSDPAANPSPAAHSGDEELERARDICLAQLSYSPHTRSQLADAMRRRGVDAAVAADVLGRLAAVGLIDDEAFAAAWVDSRHRGRGVGPLKIANELRTRGIAPDLAAASIETITPDQQRAAARAIVDKRLAMIRGGPTAVRAQRLVGVLARRGYPPAIAYEVVREALAGEGFELPEPDSEGL